MAQVNGPNLNLDLVGSLFGPLHNNDVEVVKVILASKFTNAQVEQIMAPLVEKAIAEDGMIFVDEEFSFNGFVICSASSWKSSGFAVKVNKGGW